MNIGKWLRNILLGLVILAFVAVFGQPGGGGNATGAVAEISGESIPRDVFEFFRELRQREMRESIANLDSEQATQILDSQTLGGLMRRYIMAQEAESLGLGVPDAALRAELQRNPSFQNDGRYDRELVERVVARTGLGQREYMAQHRRDLLLREFSRLVESTVLVSDAAIRDEIVLGLTSVQLRYAIADADQLADPKKVTDEDVAKLLSDSLDRVRTAYAERITEYRKDEEIRAAHILFTGQDAGAEALKARARIEAGEDFAEVAKEVSADPATRDQGGDLGRFPRGRMLPAFDEVAFSLETGALSGPVETERGTHLIRVQEHQQASETPFDDASEQIARDLLLRDQGVQAARDAIDRLIAGTQAGKDFMTAAKPEKGLDLRITPPFKLSEAQAQGLEGFPGVVEAAFSLSDAKPHLPRPIASGTRVAAISLFKRSEPDEDAIAKALEPTRQQLTQRARALTTGLWYQEKQQDLERDGQLQRFPLYPQN